MNELSACDLVAYVPSGDLARARKFYRNVLGLHLVSEDAHALVFDANGTMLRIFHFTGAIPSHYTILGWVVPDLDPLVADLKSYGVTLERYPSFEQDQDGIWTAEDGTRVAWFKDLDGNILSITQFC